MTITNQKITKEPEWELYDYVFDLEKEWRKSLPKFNNKELIGIFGRENIREIFKEKEKEKKKLVKIVKNKLIKSYQLYDADSFSGWFDRYWLELNEGEKLNKLEKDIWNIKKLLYPPKTKPGQITDEMIKRAKEYPITELIEYRGYMASCPWHKDKRPSLNLKNNFAYCHSCGYAADSIKLYQDLTGADFKTAIKSLQQ